MAFGDAPFFQIIRERLSFLSQRQRVLAQNVANSSTPKYTPKDLDESSFNNMVSRIMPNSNGSVGGPNIAQVNLVATNPMHISSGSGASYTMRRVNAPDSETTLDGNKVVLEEQMIKVADTRMNYDIAIGLYQKGIEMMRLAAKRPGG